MRRLVVAVVGLWVVLGWSSGAGAVPIQWTVAEGGNGHWYGVIGNGVGGTSESFAWNDARLDAVARGGYLATPTSAAEWSFIKSSYAAMGWPSGAGILGWLGGYQNTSSPSFSEPGGGWEWVTGESWSFTAWSGGEPNNAAGGTEHYLLTWFNSGSSWNDHYDQPFRYFIEYDTNPIPEPSTALLLGIGLVGMAARRRV